MIYDDYKLFLHSIYHEIDALDLDTKRFIVLLYLIIFDSNINNYFIEGIIKGTDSSS